MGSAAGHQLRVVVLGDSVGTGAGCGCAPFGPRLARLLAGPLAQPVRVATLAQDGLTTPALVRQLSGDPNTIAQVRRADAVAIVIGANDFDADAAGTACTGTGTACFDAALAALPLYLNEAITRVRGLANPQVRILVLGYWNVFLDGVVGAQQGATYQNTSDALTKRVDAELAERASLAGATYVDLYAAFHRDEALDDTALLASDGDHPNAAGHQRIAEVLVPYLLAHAR